MSMTPRLFLLCLLALACALLLVPGAESSVVPTAALSERRDEESLIGVVKQFGRRRRRRGFGGDDDEGEEDEQEGENAGDEDVNAGASGNPDADDDNNFLADCFPAAARVVLEDGRVANMSELVVGDRVRVSLDGAASDVFMFTHALRSGVFPFMRLETESGHVVHVSRGHYVYASGALVPAKDVRRGDSLEVLGAGSSQVVRVSHVREQGLYNPQTLHGDIVVDGVRMSTYTTAVPPVIAHGLLLAPLRALWSAFGVDSTFGVFSRGLPTTVTPALKRVLAHPSPVM